jgi:hypothetical protein
MFNTTYRSRKADYLAVCQGPAPLVRMFLVRKRVAPLRHQGCLNPLTRPG